MYDMIIIDGGLIGFSAARKLSKTQVKTGVLEKDNDLSNGAS